jgi:hypothetical protein
MWAIDNRTPYAAERNWTRDKRGAHLWIVAVKATFSIRDTGTLALADEQKPPVLAPEYHGEPGKSSLRLDSDLLSSKPCTDVIADAHAHAPRGRAAERVQVSMRVGELHKTLLVYGNRVYYKGGLAGGLTTTQPQPFESRPIRYEWAYGGMDVIDPDPRRHRIDARNPIGVGFAVDPARLQHKPAPAVEYPSGDIANVGPAGFGPIDAAWSPRRELAGTYDEAWEKHRKPLLADDYQELYGSCAPADQRAVQHLHGGERVELVNLTPGGNLRFDLPKIYLTFTTHFGRRSEEHRSRMTAVVVEPEKMNVSLVWQTALPVPSKHTEYLDETTIAEKPYLT